MATTSLTSPPLGNPTITPGMGANLLDGGQCRFRVWAPHAERVSVVGSFNEWNPNSHFLSHEDSGYWAGVIEGAQYRDEYKFAIHAGEEILLRNDPYAREMTNSDGITYNGFGQSGLLTLPAYSALIYSKVRD